MFFDAVDPLVPQATNGKEDVYEYEPVGVGGASGCTVALPTYVPSAAGCVSLVSSGTSSEESVFLDASKGGSNVFFLSAAQLVPQDVGTSLSVFDAHACSAESPCVSAPVSPPPCSSGDACKAAPSPQPAIFGAPASATFSGAGNLTAVTPAVVEKATKKTVKCKKGFTKKKNKCVKNKKSKHAKRASRDRRGK